MLIENFIAIQMAAGGKGMQPHPRNGPNRKAEAHLKALEERMQAEVLAWESEKQDLAEYEAETDRLILLFREGKMDELEVLAESQRPAGELLPQEEEGELDEEEVRAREEAQAAMIWAQALDSGSLSHPQQEADEAAGTKASRRQSKGKAKAIALPSNQGDLDGSEHDKRLEDVEFNVSTSHRQFDCFGGANTDTALHRSIFCDKMRTPTPNYQVLRRVICKLFLRAQAALWTSAILRRL
jgi:hypothetical protein